MRAFAIEQAGQPAQLTTIAEPELGPTDIRIAVHASSVNGFDVFQSLGYLAGMMEHRYPTVIGRDLAGVVDAIGAEVTNVAVGDPVFGFLPATPPLQRGTWAEQVSGSDLVLAAKPAGLDAETAAVMPLAGSAALDLLDAAAVAAGGTLLVVGATGGVGTFVIQLAASRGVTVIATARPDEVAYVRDLGASDTIDYTAGSVEEAARARYPDGVDGLIDLVNQKDGLTAIAGVVRRGGHIASLLNGADAEASQAQGVTATNVMATPTPDKLRTLAGLVDSGALRVPIQATFSMDQLGDAIAAFQAGTRGKIAVRIR
jgi:NADPH2:quinone reductase